MGSYFLYLIVQAFVALAFAYLSGTMLMRERRLPKVLIAAGFYLIMGAALVELWGERGGWTPQGVGLFAGLVCTGVGLLGVSALLEDAVHLEGPVTLRRLGQLLAVLTVVAGLALVVGGGTSDAIVDPGRGHGTGVAGGYYRLGPAGWALGSPLLLGAALMMVVGVRTALARAEGRGLWMLGGGVLFLLWPFDPQLSGLPLSPSIMVLGLAMAFFGSQAPRGDGTVEGPSPEDADRGGKPSVHKMLDRGDEDERGAGGEGEEGGEGWPEGEGEEEGENGGEEGSDDGTGGGPGEGVEEEIVAKAGEG